VKTRIYIPIEFLIILLVFVIGINSQFEALTNKYVFNDDARQHVYWTQQFRDCELFRNDLLTEYARNIQPWGFILFYYLTSFICDPFFVSKMLPIILFSISGLYVFKLIKHITNNIFSSFLGALIFMFSPVYLSRMVGGNARSFGYPLLIAFLYYLIKTRYFKLSITMILQSLFYPPIFLVSILTYAFCLIKIKQKKIYFDISLSKRFSFIIVVLLSGFVLLSKDNFTQHNPSIGRIITYREMVNWPELYEYKKGRAPYVHLPPLKNAIVEFSREPFLQHPIPEAIHKRILKCTNLKITRRTIRLIGSWIFLALSLFLIFEIARKKFSLPVEILFLFLSSSIWYKMADLLTPRILSAYRYLKYPVTIVSLMIFTMAIGQIMAKIKGPITKKVLQFALVILLVCLGFNINKNVALLNKSQNKDLYEYLNSLPKNIMIASHPVLADDIPILSQRKVFINYELSFSIFHTYLTIIKKRTFDFFKAYYSEDPRSIYRFCEENSIDYLVIDKRHFTKEYLNEGDFYFEPFNTYILNIVKERQNFALRDIPEEAKTFQKNHIFVVQKDVLKH